MSMCCLICPQGTTSGFQLLVTWPESPILSYHICQPCANVPGALGHVSWVPMQGQLIWATSIHWVLKTTISVFECWWLLGLDSLVLFLTLCFILSNATIKYLSKLFLLTFVCMQSISKGVTLQLWGKDSVGRIANKQENSKLERICYAICPKLVYSCKYVDFIY